MLRIRDFSLPYISPRVVVVGTVERIQKMGGKIRIAKKGGGYMKRGTSTCLRYRVVVVGGWRVGPIFSHALNLN